MLVGTASSFSRLAGNAVSPRGVKREQLTHIQNFSQWLQ